MKNLLRKRGTKAKSLSTHQFEVRGCAPFVRFSGGCTVRFNLSQRIELAASGGLLGTPSVPSTIEGGTFRIKPLEACRLQAEYSRPMYLLSYSRLKDVLRNRFDLEIWIRPQWRANLWPYLFDFYMSYGRWPTWQSEYVRLFRRVLAKAKIGKIASAQGGDGLDRVHARVIVAMLARFAVGRSAATLAAQATRIAHAFFNTEYFEELLAEMEMFESISVADSVIPLAGEYVEDEIWFKVPFEIVQAQKVSITGAMKVEHKRKYGDFFERELLCSYLELYPTSPIVIPPLATIRAPQARVPLDVGEKKVYGMTVSAPLTCKAEKVWMELLDPPKRFPKVVQRKKSAPAIDPTNLYFELFGTEA